MYVVSTEYKTELSPFSKELIWERHPDARIYELNLKEIERQ